jgi:predicted Zn-ribbon and HTH transcriptional regulator
LEWTILLALLLRPFRCRQCSARHLGFFFRRRRVKEANTVVAG